MSFYYSKTSRDIKYKNILYLKLVPSCSSVAVKQDFTSYICSDGGFFFLKDLFILPSIPDSFASTLLDCSLWDGLPMSTLHSTWHKFLWVPHGTSVEFIIMYYYTWFGEEW